MSPPEPETNRVRPVVVALVLIAGGLTLYFMIDALRSWAAALPD